MQANAAQSIKIIDGRQRISEITNGEIMAYVTNHSAMFSNATVNIPLQILGRALRHMGKIYTKITRHTFIYAQHKTTNLKNASGNYHSPNRLE